MEEEREREGKKQGKRAPGTGEREGRPGEKKRKGARIRESREEGQMEFPRAYTQFHKTARAFL
jgi:hypothetical protein